MQRFAQGSDTFVGGFFEPTLQAGRQRDTSAQLNGSDLPLWDIRGMHSSTFIPAAIAYQCISNIYYHDHLTSNLDHFNNQPYPQPQLGPYSPFQYCMTPPMYNQTSPTDISQTLIGPVTDFDDMTGYEAFSSLNGGISTTAAVDHWQTLSTPHRRPTDPRLLTSVGKTDQDDLLTPGLPPTPYPSAKTSRRPAPSGKPDCAPSLQRAIGCVLWSLDFHCGWDECLYAVHRTDFYRYEDYLEDVIKHLKRHSGPRGPGWTCKWQGVCQAKVTRSVRDQQRHLRSHLPFYNLCIQCGKLAARPDARGRSNPCRQGTCRPKEGIRDKIKVANSGHNKTLKDFYNAIFN